MPAEALHNATTRPRTSAASEPADDRPAADWMAWLNTFDAPGRGAVATMHRAGADLHHVGHAQQGHHGREEGQEPVVGQAPAIMVQRSALNSLALRLRVLRQPVSPSSGGVRASRALGLRGSPAQRC
jgi:hypothetical protein